jgi:hypothetical protein
MLPEPKFKPIATGGIPSLQTKQIPPPTASIACLCSPGRKQQANRSPFSPVRSLSIILHLAGKRFAWKLARLGNAIARKVRTSNQPSLYLFLPPIPPDSDSNSIETIAFFHHKKTPVYAKKPGGIERSIAEKR